MDIKGSVAFVTGANGGIGHAFVDELLKRGAAKVYATVRDPVSLGSPIGQDSRLVPIVLDVTDPMSIEAAAAQAKDVSLLINNAGYMGFTAALGAPNLDNARQEMDVNYFGPLALARAFRPALAAAGGGAMVNMLSMAALVSLPVTGTYSASKAALLSLTRSIRAELAAQGTCVIGVIAVQTETVMGVRLPPPRQTPEEVATDALDAVIAGVSVEVAAGELTRSAYMSFMADPMAFQAKISARLLAPPEILPSGAGQ